MLSALCTNLPPFTYSNILGVLVLANGCQLKKSIISSGIKPVTFPFTA
jgi:hypothetical protein